MPTNIAKLLTETASKHGDRPALKLDDSDPDLRHAQRWRRPGRGPAESNGASSRATASGSCFRTCRTSPLVYYGVLRAGGVVVPMNVLLKGREIGFYLVGLRGEADVRLARVR